MAKLIGTAGHVDHGKTTLIRALTGIDADRLPEEKRRGMTIDIGFAYIDLPLVGRVSIVDVPGHERFVTNMLVGALAFDIALLCVAADEGVKPQTTEHFEVLKVLPVQKMVVAITRVDLADQSRLQSTRDQVTELLGSTRFAGCPVVEVSASVGTGIEELRVALSESLAGEVSVPPSPWYLPIDRAFTMKGHGLVVTGTLAGSPLTSGCEATLQPGGKECRIRSIHVHGDAVEASEPGSRTALNVGGLKLEEVRRGMVLGEPGTVFETRVLDAKVSWVAEAKHGARIRASIGADEAMGRMFLAKDDPQVVQLRLEQPIACVKGQPLIVRNYSPQTLVCGGVVVVPQAKARKRSEASMVGGPQVSDTEAVLQVLEAEKQGTSLGELARRVGRPERAMSPILEQLAKQSQIRGLAGYWMMESAYQTAVRAVGSALADLHERYPAHAFLPRDRVMQRAGIKLDGKPLEKLLSLMAADGQIVMSGTSLRDKAFKPQLSGRQQEFLDRVIALIDASGVNVPGPAEIARSLGVPPQAVEEILRLGVKNGMLVRVGEGLFYTQSGLDRLTERMRAHFKDRRFAASDFRDLFETSRKYAIPVLEYFDSVRFTLRVGDNRVIRTDP